MYYPKRVVSFTAYAFLAANAFAEPVNIYPGNRGEGNLDPRSLAIRGSTPLLRRNTYPYPSYEDCVNSIQDVAKDKSAFYSGLGYYPNGQGYQYLKDFVQDKGLLEVDSVYPEDFCTSDPNLNGGYGAYISFAYSFSGLFAQKSSGTAYLLTPSHCDPSPNSIWHTVERGNLTSSDNDAQVTKIIRVDPATTSISTTIFPTPTDSDLPSLPICPTDPPLPSGGATSTSNSATRTPTETAVAQQNPECGPIRDVKTSDAMDAQKSLAAKGNGASRDNCCVGRTSSCGQVAASGTAAVNLCVPEDKVGREQCAGCGDLAISLNVINVDCTRDYMVGGKVEIPYLEGVTLELKAGLEV